MYTGRRIFEMANIFGFTFLVVSEGSIALLVVVYPSVCSRSVLDSVDIVE
jgi:hypothetical protein